MTFFVWSPIEKGDPTMIKRKPVPKALPVRVDQKLVQECVKEVALITPVQEDDLVLHRWDTDDSLLECYLLSDHEKASQQSDEERPPKHPDVDVEVRSLSSQASIPQAVPTDSKSTKLRNAFEEAVSEAKHFAGGLISHPHQSTRHFSVLRHSLGLIYYHGPMTNVVITILSDHPLPADRTIWLQKRGFSGKTGLAIGAALGTRNTWSDVTPITRTTPDQVPKAHERAWQRDISSFSKKVREVKYIRDHTPRETNVIRIPHEVEDGYFRILICSGRKVLCPSPTFRYASTSTDPGSLRGASILTLPLEVGLKVGARMATTAANAATHHTLKPAAVVVQTASRQVEGTPVYWLGIRGNSASSESDGGFSVKR